MAITYPLSIPVTYADATSDIMEFEITNINAIGGTMSPFTGQQDVQEWSRNQLIVRVALVPMTNENASEWWGFFRSLRSGLGTFIMGDPNNTTPKGTAATSPGAPLVAGGSQTGTALVIDGAPANQTGWLLRGDWIQLGSGSGARLYTLAEDCNTDGSGNATLEVRPEFRSSPADNATVTTADTVGVFRLIDHPVWPVNREGFYEISFSAMEVV